MPAILLENVLREDPEVYRQFEATQRIVAQMWLLHGLNQHRPAPSCYLVTRLVAANTPGLTVVDGYIQREFEHSWLIGGCPKYVIDPYPSGLINGPMLVDVRALAPWAGTYDPSAKPPAVIRHGFAKEVEAFLAWYANAGMAISLP